MCVCENVNLENVAALVFNWRMTIIAPVNVKILRREHRQHSVVDVLIKVACLVKK
jgi:hypothetical protein